MSTGMVKLMARDKDGKTSIWQSPATWDIARVDVYNALMEETQAAPRVVLALIEGSKP